MKPEPWCCESFTLGDLMFVDNVRTAYSREAYEYH